MIGLVLAAATVAEAPSAYAVTRIGSDLTDDQVVGNRRAGMMCLPNGAIRWSDLAAGTGMDQREVVQDAIEDAGIRTTPLGETTAAPGRRVLRLRGIVRAAHASLCARHWIGGDAKALSGEIALTIEWRAESRDAADVELKHLSDVSRTVDAKQAAPAASLYRALLRDAARDLAHWLADPARPAR